MEQQPVPLGCVEERLLIDGQQRLTTLQILLAAARDVSAKLQGDDHKHTKTLLKLTRNDDPMIEDDEDRFKVWPTNVDRATFSGVMTLGSAEEIRQAFGAKKNGRTGHLIPDAYLFFHETIEEWVDRDNRLNPRFGALLEMIRQYVHVVIIDLSQQDDAQVIFETLNARGTPLLPADLVKSFWLHEADRNGADIEKLYEKYWKPLDDAASYWRKKVLQGRQQRPQIDLFLQHYLTMRTRDEVPVSHIYDVFRDWAAENPGVQALEHLSDLAKYAEIYRRLDSYPANTPEGRFFYRLQ